MSFEGKVALVTGASGAIGGAIARRLGAGGAKVACHYRGRADEAEAVVAAVRAAGSDGLTVRADVTSGADVAAMVQQTLDAWKRIDILVNTAGTTRDMLLLRMEEPDWDEVMAINLRSAYLCTRAALRPMVRQRWGRIINISSVVGIAGNAGQSNYAAAKAGMLGFTRSLAKEVATRGITVNAVAPGFIDAGLTTSLSDDQRQRILTWVPIGRFGTPDEVAEAAIFLCSEAAGYITGQVLNVDGGMVMG
ncbi:MAG: 3-oxoacyl-[acyl-carrier-protein] reductase [Chloroflexota bacterium]